MDEIPWTTVTEVADRMHRSLDRPWTLAMAAEEAGYQEHHFANLFRRAVGEPPARYCRRLRLERAAYELSYGGRPLGEAAAGAGYGSPEAFIRAFRKQFGVSPGKFRAPAQHPGVPPPPELDPTPCIEVAGPFEAWTMVVPSFGALHVAPALLRLVAARPPDGPYQLGGLAQPWGWLSPGRQELRCIRRFDTTEARGAPPPPLNPWRWPAQRYAIFAFEGPQHRIEAAFDWMARTWPSTPAGQAIGYGPAVSLVERLHPLGGRARLYLPLREEPP